MIRSRFSRLALSRALPLLGAALVIGGCAVHPEPMSEETYRELIAADRLEMFPEQEAITAPIALEEAIARAISYNLESRVALMEETVRSGQLDLAKMDMLPRLAANAGWRTRSNDYLTVSRSTTTGQVSPDPSQSQDQTRHFGDLTMSWNVLDFGVSYFEARQKADEVLVAEQRRRRISNQIVQQVRSAFWRAATAEPLAEEAGPLLEQAREALADARSAEQERLAAPLENLNYQKGLLEIIENLQQVKRDLTVARVELATLMGLPPGTRFSLELPDLEATELPNVDMSVTDMEALALLRRPEMREEGYQKRITAHEARKALLRMLPGLNLYGGINYDSNSYLVNNDWYEAGTQVTWNLMSLVRAPTERRLNRARADLGDARRLALGIAIISQVHIGYQEYLRRLQSFEQKSELNDVEGRIFEHVRRASDAQAETPLQLIRARLSALFAEVTLYQAYADLQTATANLYVSIGMNPLPATVESHDLETLTRAIGEVLDRWNRGDLEVVDGALL